MFLRLFQGLGLLAVGFVAWVQFTGWASTPTDRANAPRSVRDNPGSYRQHYNYSRVYVFTGGGK